MALINDNPLVSGARGNFGKKYVYKKRGKNTHIARMPTFDKDAVPTEKQEQMRDRFASASMYVQGAVSSPDLKKEYDKKAPSGKTAANIAFRDYLRAPVVKSIDTSRYTGNAGSTIVISAKDDFRVAAVTVSIRTASGVLVEEGEALLNPIDRNKWTYTAAQHNATPAGSLIRATAKDIPGNEGILEMTI